jgi:signal transduction histidine kinase
MIATVAEMSVSIVHQLKQPRTLMLANARAAFGEQQPQRCLRWWDRQAVAFRKQEEERAQKEIGRLEERTRIAQELHDTLLQVFLSASIQLGAVLNNVPEGSPSKPQLDRILQIMERGIEEGRNAIRDLRSSDARALDPIRALSGIQQELAVSPDIDFRVVVAGLRQPLESSVAYEIYRMAREALVNAFRHSGAKTVELELEYGPAEVRMRVRDNGCGIDLHVLNGAREGHWGLAGMRERATRIGGRLEISSTATTGTKVQLSIPNRTAFRLSHSDRTGDSWSRSGSSGQKRTLELNNAPLKS